MNAHIWEETGTATTVTTARVMCQMSMKGNKKYYVPKPGKLTEQEKLGLEYYDFKLMHDIGEIDMKEADRRFQIWKQHYYNFINTGKRYKPMAMPQRDAQIAYFNAVNASIQIQNGREGFDWKLFEEDRDKIFGMWFKWYKEKFYPDEEEEPIQEKD
ncbi:MAG TPA: hypothetical protein ENI04_01215 [Candidatus Wildermuthbacteria bacterium]|nr:hypothetical protein [Candidatus Wildermuthbacteria bacterium]